jgi:acetyltransferase
MIKIHQLSSEQATAQIEKLIAVLQDSVDGGASVGFLPPLDHESACEYWEGVISSMASGSRLLFVATDEGTNRIAGTIQLELAGKANGRHRAEVQKLMVHRDFRRRGIAQMLMDSLESTARQVGRSLLVLDTRQGDSAEQLYLKMDYICAGVIPQYALSSDGHLHSTVFFYKILV